MASIQTHLKYLSADFEYIRFCNRTLQATTAYSRLKRWRYRHKYI